MIRRLISGPQLLVEVINDHASALEKVSNISGDGLITVNHSQNGLFISLDKERLQEFIPRFLGGSSTPSEPVEITWATIIQAPEYANPESYELAEGRAFYTVRPLTDTTVEWAVGTTYVLDTLVIDDLDNLQYKAVNPTELDPYTNIGHQPSTDDGTYWALQEETRISHALGQDDKDLRLFIPWFEIGTIVPVIDTTVSGSPRSYIWTAFTYCGTDSQASLRWNQTDGRAMACYK